MEPVVREVQPWFDPAAFGWVPGLVIGLLGGLFGLGSAVAGRQPGAAGVVGRMLAAWAYWLAIVLGLAFLAVGAIGAASGQPYAVWYSLALPGLVGLVVMAGLFPVLRRLTR